MSVSLEQASAACNRDFSAARFSVLYLPNTKFHSGSPPICTAVQYTVDFIPGSILSKKQQHMSQLFFVLFGSVDSLHLSQHFSIVRMN